MKAIIYESYGSPDKLILKEIEKPTLKDDGVLIKVHAAAVNALDWHFMRGTPVFVRAMTGLFRPKNKTLGADVAGRVEAVGRNVTQFRPGDEVFGGITVGGFAEYASAAESRFALKPTNLTFEQAAAVPVAALTALQGLRDCGQIQAGQKVLINGASGGVGTFAVQIAKAFGAEVTAVCSTGKLELAKSIGADRVIDYTRKNFTQMGERYDLIIGANGFHSIFDYRRTLAPNGTYVTTGGSMSQNFQSMLLGPILSKFGDKKMVDMLAKTVQADLEFMKELIEVGKVEPVIDRTYQLHKTADAIRYIEEGHAKGKIVISVFNG